MLKLINNRGAAAIWAAVGLALIALTALGSRPVAAVDEARCDSAMALQNDPMVIAFKQCAGVSPIPRNCCIKMVPFIQYSDCLGLSRFKTVADQFLAPAVTVDRALKECLGR